jgi:hypothetical protein
VSQSPATLASIRGVVDGVWHEVSRWLLQKPRVFSLAHPEQQILFEFASRLREALRQASGQPRWDRLYFDGSSISLGSGSVSHVVGRRPPIFVDTRRLLGLQDTSPRSAANADIAVSLQVLRAPPAQLDLDEDGRPRSQRWMPVSLRVQGFLLEEHVAELERLTASPCDGTLIVIYSNETGRRTAVDSREIVSWASWHQPAPTFWWSSRHFRAREPT